MTTAPIKLEFRIEDNIVTAYDGKYSVATLNVDNGLFEESDEMTESQEVECEKLMYEAHEEGLKHDYDVSEHGVYGNGY